MDVIEQLLKTFVPDLTPGYLKDFHQEVLQALSDGKLTEQEIATLEKRKEALGLTDEALSAVKQDLYAAAFQTASDDEQITEDEWDELEHIQDFLNVEDRDIAKTKKQLYRLRILTELRKGTLPVIKAKDVLLLTGESAHWVEQGEVREAKKSTKGITWELLGPGTLVITNKRMIVKAAGKTRAHRLTQIIDAQYSKEGITLHINARSPLFFSYGKSENKDVVVSILLAALDTARQQLR